MGITFTVLTPENTARVTLSDPRANNYHSREILTIADTRGIANAILAYARERGIDPRAVEYSVVWPSRKVTANPCTVGGQS